MHETAFIRTSPDPVDCPCKAAHTPMEKEGEIFYMGLVRGKHRPKNAVTWKWLEPEDALAWAASKGYSRKPETGSAASL